MTTNSHSESAQIFNFADFAAKLRPVPQRREESYHADDFAAPRRPQTTFGGAWYHEEAIQESEQPRTH